MSALHATVDVFGAVALAATLCSGVYVAVVWAGRTVAARVARRRRLRVSTSLSARPSRQHCRPRAGAYLQDHPAFGERGDVA